MIYECLIAPSESSYSLLEIKRALLTYDKVQILDPNDRDLMPSSLFNSAIGFFSPVGIIGQPVRPMGKTIGYDDIFDKVLEQLRPAIQQNLLEVKSIFIPTSEVNTSLFIGNPPTFDYPLHERFIYNLYRGLTENKDLITDIISPTKHSLLKQLESSSGLALGGIADTRTNDGPELPFYEDENLSDLQRGALTQIARARVSTLIKCAGYCQSKNIIPVFNSNIYGKILSYVINTSHKTISEIEDDELWIRRNRVLELCHEEFIDDNTLNEMGINDVIKLRTKTWGDQAKNREGLFDAITTLALETNSDALFKEKAISKLDEYRKQSGKLISERHALKFNITCDLINATCMAAPATAGLLGQISPGWSVGLTLLGAAPWATRFFKDNKKALEDIKTAERNAKRSACLGLHNFYSKIPNSL